MLHPTHTYSRMVPLVLVLAAGLAHAEEAVPPATDALPGSPLPAGLGLAPEAPPVAPVAGGRAPSFGAPTEKSPATFKISGRLYGWEAVGIGSKPKNPPEGYSGTPLHVPVLSTGKIPFWGGSGATLNFSYGTPKLTAVATYYFRVNRQEYQGYANPTLGPGFGVAYLLYAPDPIQGLKLQIKVGSFLEIYGGPGQWGWGIFGPMLALRGTGELVSGENDLSSNLKFQFAHGAMVVPGVPENFPRGEYNSWIETGVTSWVHHAHVGLVYKNQYTFRAHYASDYSTDERKVLKTFLTGPPKDGRIDVVLGEAWGQGEPWGRVGVTGGLYNFKDSASVHDGIWWAVDWTQGAREMVNKYLGAGSGGNGKVAVVGAEYNFSVSRILWFPRSFNGNAPDIRVAIAGMLTRTMVTGDPAFKNAMGYFFGVDTEYRMTKYLSLTFQSYGESRDSNLGTYGVYSLNPGIALRTDWNSMDRIQLIYGRRFYSAAADPNTAQPLDRHMIALGGYVTF